MADQHTTMDDVLDPDVNAAPHPSIQQISEQLDDWIKALERDAKTDRRQSARNQKRILYGGLWAIITVWFVLLCIALNRYVGLDEGSDFAAVGDTLGAANTLFSGFSLVFIVLAISLQDSQLQVQRKEVEEQRRDMWVAIKAQIMSSDMQGQELRHLRRTSRTQRLLDLLASWEHEDMLRSRAVASTLVQRLTDAGMRVPHIGVFTDVIATARDIVHHESPPTGDVTEIQAEVTIGVRQAQAVCSIASYWQTIGLLVAAKRVDFGDFRLLMGAAFDHWEESLLVGLVEASQEAQDQQATAICASLHKALPALREPSGP